MTQLSPMKSWNLMCPFVVSASKSGAVEPNLNFACGIPSTALSLPILTRFAGGEEILSEVSYICLGSFDNQKIEPAKQRYL